MLETAAIIVAAGQGSRVGGILPKQFQSVGGKPILSYTLQKFEDCSRIQDVILVTASEWVTYTAQEIVEPSDLKKVIKIVAGGEQRQDSVFAGLKALEGHPDFVAIHDAVRPFISVEKLEAAIDACKKHGAAILAVPPKDTIKTEKSGFVDETPDRSFLWSVQTPQVFKYDLIMKAYQKAFEDGVYHTDDSALVERIGMKVKIVEGEHDNIKVTVPMDLKWAEIKLTMDN